MSASHFLTHHCVTILGSTGSIGRSTLDVISRHPDCFRVFALVAHQDADALLTQCQQFRPAVAILTDAYAADRLRTQLKSHNLTTKVYTGKQALLDAVTHPDVDTVVAAITGAAGLLPTLNAFCAGKRVLLANKESMVMAGALFRDAMETKGGILLPIDSEHNAIFQVLPRDYQGNPHDHGVRRIYLTASGGALRDYSEKELDSVTPQQALRHPNWVMGPKVTIDSATMMNKGLELIEAAWLFNLSLDQMEILIHPQSVIHSMVEYLDGSTLAQLSHADMRVPIAQALSFPARIDSGVKSLDWATLSALTFELPNITRYPCLQLAKAALQSGGTAPAILNAANEIAVDAFLNCRIRFTQIACVVETAMSAVMPQPVEGLDAIWAADHAARTVSKQFIETLLEKKRG